MADKTADAYRYAEGSCLNAMILLRRFAGTEAIASLKTAIRTIESEQMRARREDGLKFDRVPAAAPDYPPDVQF